MVPLSRPLLSLALETLQERAAIASSQPLVGLLRRWLGAPGPEQEICVSPNPGVWRYQDVALAGLAAALGEDDERFEKGLVWLMARKFFLPNRTPGFEGDPLAILTVAIAVRAARPTDSQATAWVRDLARQAASLETDAWRLSMLTAAANLVDPAGGWADVSADLVVALDGKGYAQSSEQTRSVALSQVLDLGVEPDERAVVRLAALARLLAFEATIELPRPTVGDVARLLEAVPAALKRWPREKTPRTKREGLVPQKWDLPTEYHVQALLWALLRPVFSDLKDEEYLRSIGYKHPRVDLAIPSLRLIIEVKFLYGAAQADLADTIGGVAQDASLYLSEDNGFDHILAFVWDSTASVQHHATLADGLRKLRGVVDAVVVSRPGNW